MSRREERARAQWIKVSDQLRFVPAGNLPEDLGIDMRSAVEAEREPLFGERVRGDGKIQLLKATRERRLADAKRNRREWHDDLERRVAALEVLLDGLRAEGGV